MALKFLEEHLEGCRDWIRGCDDPAELEAATAAIGAVLEEARGKYRKRFAERGPSAPSRAGRGVEKAQGR